VTDSVLGRVRAHLARHGEWWWVPAFYTLVVLWTYRDLWHQHGAATGFGWDVIDTHAPDLEFMARELREGRFSLWNPWDKGGYAVYADPVVCRYYPLAWPFVGWGAAFGVSWWLIQIELLAHHVAMAACRHLFLRVRGLSLRAAMIGGVGLVVSTPVLLHKASSILWPLVWVPLIWLAIDAALARPSWRRGAGVAAAFTLCATAGSPPGMFYAALLIVPYAVWRLVTVRPAWRPLLGCAAVAGGLAGLVLALTVLPTQSLVALATRDRWASGDAFALSLSFPWRAVMRGAYAPSAGAPEMYLGAAIVLLALCALVLPRRDAGVPWLFVALAIGGLVLVAGATLPVLPWLVHHVPGFALLRIPGRYKLLAAWGLAAAAAYGADGLDGRRWRGVVIAVAILCAIVVATVVLAGSARPRPAWWSIAAIAIPGALAVLATRVPRLRTIAMSALVLVVLFDAPAFMHRIDAPPAAERRQLHPRDAELLAKLDGIRDRWRVHDEFMLGERAGQRLGVRDLRGYPAVDPLSQRRYVDVLDYAKHAPAIVTDYNVRWVLQGTHFRFGGTASFLPPLTGDAFVARGDRIFEAAHPAPLIAWYGAATFVALAKDVLPAVRAAEDADGVRRHAILEPDAIAAAPAVVRLAGGAPASVTGALVTYEPDEIVATVDAPGDGVVVLNELAFPGWTVEVDGAPRPAARANYVMRAVYVEAGHHQIRWRFEPPRIRALIAGYLAALAVMLAAAAWPRRRSAPAAASPPG
jgi:hypothetical protein